MQKIFFALVLLFILAPLAAAQPEKSRAPGREFGWSLKQKPPEISAENKNQTAETGADDAEVIRVETNLVVSREAPLLILKKKI